MTNLNSYHIPIMVNEILDCLAIQEGDVIFDGTLGGGGHASEILKNQLVHDYWGCDKDEDSYNYLRLNLKNDLRFKFIKNDFKNFLKIVEEYKINKIDKIILDLGVSSYQLDTPERGFSYSQDCRLDMRMDRCTGESAAEVIKNCDEEFLANIIYNYGEERFSRVIAKEICRKRNFQEISTSFQLAEIIRNIIRGSYTNKQSSIKRVFQALRIYVNQELENLDRVVQEMIKFLSPRGRMVVLTFHSLEDKIVKKAFKELTLTKEISLLNKHIIVADRSEQNENSRSKSAKLRAIVKNEI